MPRRPASSRRASGFPTRCSRTPMASPSRAASAISTAPDCWCERRCWPRMPAAPTPTPAAMPVSRPSACPAPRASSARRSRPPTSLPRGAGAVRARWRMIFFTQPISSRRPPARWPLAQAAAATTSLCCWISRSPSMPSHCEPVRQGAVSTLGCMACCRPGSRAICCSAGATRPTPPAYSIPIRLAVPTLGDGRRQHA